MSLIKLGLDSMAVSDKIQFGRQIVQALTDNPNFPDPIPLLPAVTTGSDTLETSFNDAQTARQIAKSKTSAQDADAATLDWSITQLANFIESASDGDRVKMESAGFSLRNPPAPIGQLSAPTNLQVFPGDHPGSADVSWKSERGAKAFNIARAEDAPELEYHIIGSSTKKAATLNSMTSGKKYWFRVAAIGAAGQSAWSTPVALFAP